MRQKKFVDFYTHKRQWKLILVLFAVIIGFLSLAYTNRLVKQLKVEEKLKIELWAEATMAIANNEDFNTDINFYLKVITNNTTIPVILVDDNDSIISANNFSKKQLANPKYLRDKLHKIKEERDPILIKLEGEAENRIYYSDSTILRQLIIYPYVQLAIITLFILLAYMAFSNARNAEQNQVWVGMSKETAHQLGTPISSLMAWLDILEQSEENAPYLSEMGKDIDRLQMIAERFSKIGSKPDLQLTDLVRTLEAALNYMKTRTSKNVGFITNLETLPEVIVPLNKSLFHWVIENLIKNAVDAMEGKGTITITLTDYAKEVTLEITDTGKGIAKNKQKAIFNPGYTSKDRGWGLGLSLAKRIIEQYHGGRIFVAASEINQGATFKILLPK